MIKNRAVFPRYGFKSEPVLLHIDLISISENIPSRLRLPIKMVLNDKIGFPKEER